VGEEEDGRVVQLSEERSAVLGEDWLSCAVREAGAGERNA